MSLGACFPRPKRVTIGGTEYLAREFKLRHMARIDSWIVDNLPDPLAAIDADDPEARKEALKAAYEGSKLPKGMGSPEGDALFYGTTEGRALFLRLALRHSKLSSTDARALACLIEPDEWHAVERIAYAMDQWMLIVSRIDRELGIEPFDAADDGEAISWAEAIAETSREWKVSVEQIGSWFLSQWRMVRSGGKDEGRGEPVPRDQELAGIVQRRRWEFWQGNGNGNGKH